MLPRHRIAGIGQQVVTEVVTEDLPTVEHELITEVVVPTLEEVPVAEVIIETTQEVAKKKRGPAPKK